MPQVRRPGARTLRGAAKSADVNDAYAYLPPCGAPSIAGGVQ